MKVHMPLAPNETVLVDEYLDVELVNAPVMIKDEKGEKRMVQHVRYEKRRHVKGGEPDEYETKSGAFVIPHLPEDVYLNPKPFLAMIKDLVKTLPDSGGIEVIDVEIID